MMQRFFNSTKRHFNHVNCIQSFATKNKREMITKSVSQAHLKVIGSGAPGEPASLALVTPNVRFVFNCGEGTDRIARTNSLVRWSSVKHIFLTQTSWKHIGGLTCIMREINYNLISIIGPNKLKDFICRMKAIIGLNGLNLSIDVVDESTELTLNDVQFECIKLSSSQKNKPDVMAYICNIPPYMGKLNLEKCIDNDLSMDVIRKIENNENILLSNGTQIQYRDFKNNIDNEHNFIVLDIPSSDYLHELNKNTKLLNYISTKRSTELIVHFSPPNIFNDQEYQQFLQNINPNRNWLINETNQYSGLFKAYKRQIYFNHLNSNIFPKLSLAINENSTIFHCDKDNGNSYGVSSDAIYLLRGTHVGKMIRNTIDDEYDIEQSGIDSSRNSNIDRLNVFPKIVFLGTGSQLAGPNRNCTSILVHINESYAILLDCGEGTVNQIRHFYGNKWIEIIEKIKIVFISHFHGDHHQGLYGLLDAKNSFCTNNRSTTLLVPSIDIKSWMSYPCDQHEFIINNNVIVWNEDLLKVEMEYLAKDIGLNSLRTCQVDHIAHSYGIALSMDAKNCNDNSIFKITFSGDTMPCQSLCELGQNSTILIHEATFENEMFESAKSKAHSTIEQAIEQGKKMNAKYTILTHFSSRYYICPNIENELDENVSIAFDFMEIIESDLFELRSIYPCVKKKFSRLLRRNQ